MPVSKTPFHSEGALVVTEESLILIVEILSLPLRVIY